MSRMRKFFFLTIVIVAGLLSAEVGSSEDWTSLREASKNIRSVKAEFLQKRYLQILTKPLLSEGRFFFNASGSLRWEYLSPVRSVMLQRGDAIQLYHFSEGMWKPEMTQAVESRRMVLLEISRWFQGRFDESKIFRNLYLPGPPARVVLIPKEGIDKFIERIEVVLSARPGVIERVEIKEPGDSRTSIEFRNVEINSSFSPEVFEKP
jgi:outer membrane lipoprotein-sorting protein